MLYLIPIPIVIIAVIVYIVSDKYKLKLFKIISKIVIILGVLYFIYEFAKSLEIDFGSMLNFIK